MPSKEEILFGKIAVESGFLSQEQVDRAVQIQVASPYPRPLGVILVENEDLTDEELAKVLELQMQNLQAPAEHSREKREDAIFGKLVIKQAGLSQVEVNKALRHQASLERRGIFRRLGQILIELNLLTPEQVTETLDFQRTRILVCDTCFAQFNIRDYAAGTRYRCRRCGTILAVPRQLYTVEVVETIRGWESDSVEEELAASLDLMGDEPKIDTDIEPPPQAAQARTSAKAGGRPAAPRAALHSAKTDVPKPSPARAVGAGTGAGPKRPVAPAAPPRTPPSAQPKAAVPASARAQPPAAPRAAGPAATRAASPAVPAKPPRRTAPPPEPEAEIEDLEEERPVRVLGQMLVEKGLVSAEIVDRCVQLQLASEQKGRRRTIGEILVSEGYVTQAQLERVLAEQEADLQKTDPVTRRKLEDVIFGKLAVKQGLVEEEDVNEALRKQAHIERQENRYVRLGRLLVDQGILTLYQVVRLLEYQKKSILICGSCMSQYNIKGMKRGKTYRCKKCGANLNVPEEVTSVDVVDTLDEI